MSAITFTGLTFTGTPDADDSRAGKSIVAEENALQIALNPSFTPLPTSPAAALKTSTNTAIINRVQRGWNDRITQTKQPTTLDTIMTQLEKDTMIAAIVDRILGGTTPATLITDIAS